MTDPGEFALGSIVHATSVEVDPVRERPARVKDIAELDKSLSVKLGEVSVNTWAVGEKLRAEIRRQTEYLITAIATACPTVEAASDVAGVRHAYLAECEEADKP